MGSSIISEGLSKSKIIDEFNKGELLFNFAGHGNRVSWATHPPKNFNAWIGFGINDFYLFKNENKLPIVILDACDTGQFDKGMCLAWELVGIKEKGAIATMATTALSWEYIGSYCDKGLSGYMDVRICRNFDTGKYLGNVFYNAIENYLRWQPMDNSYDYKIVEEWTLFGDPTLKIGGYGNMSNPTVKIDTPKDGYLYINDREIMPTIFGRTLIIGKITIKVIAYNVNKVEFYFDDEIEYVDESEPYQWIFNGFAFFGHKIKVVGYGNESKSEDSKDITIFSL